MNCYGENVMRMIPVFLTLVLTASLALAQTSVPPPPQPANDAQANAEVLKLLRAGVSERTILHVISAAAGTYDTSADALAALKQAGASEAELSAIQAQGAAPANAPSAGAATTSGPSLAETMQFIQDKVNQQGKIVSHETFFDSATSERSGDMFCDDHSQVVAVDPSCGLFLQNSTTWPPQEETVIDTWTSRVDFKDIEKLEVLNAADYTHRFGMVVQYDPPFFELVIHLAAGKTVRQHRRWITGGKHGKTMEEDKNIGEFVLHFRDEETANRVAKAIIHAIELCGGGSKPEPF